jgi:beta-galactosidase
MDRRQFLRATTTVIAGTSCQTILPGQGAFASDSVERIAQREILPLNQEWRYSRQAPNGFEMPEFDDSTLEQICLPHANVKVPWHGFDEKTYQIVSAYRRHFSLPARAKAKRVFVDFEGVMTASTVWINGQRLGEYKGGYTPFSFDLTPHLDWDGDNVLAVMVDSSERPDIPPFGGKIDYLTFGGIYREVALRIVPPIYIENIFVKTRNVLTIPSIEVALLISNVENSSEQLLVETELVDGEKSLMRVETHLVAAARESVSHSVELQDLKDIKLWDLENPHLYEVVVRIRRGTLVLDTDRCRIGFREAVFTDEGFKLNGRVVKLRGLNRHQTFPFVGQAMPKRVQQRDAIILKRNLKCNIVRTSHYPQSRHFLDCCDEIGLLVLEEIPGWQHIGDEEWKLLAIDNVERMIRRDRNHPSIVLWGVRINESQDDHTFYARTNALAHSLDPTRQTGGIRYFQESEFLEDVFTMNDFGFPLKPPGRKRYLNTEFVGHTFDTKPIDNNARLIEHTLRHARIHNQIAGSPQYSGGIAWCAFDYNTHGDFGAGDRICYHGVCDIFREVKPAAGFYKSQCSPKEEVVLEPAFHWSAGDGFPWYEKAVVCSNCDHLKFYVGGQFVTESDPNRKEFRNLVHPPFTVSLSNVEKMSDDLRIEGYIDGKKVIEKLYSGEAIDQRFQLRSDDDKLWADGADTTRVVFRVTDKYSNLRPYATGAILLELDGPGEIVGDNPFALFGGLGAIWVRAQRKAGIVTLRAKHPTLGTEGVKITVLPPEA